MPGDESDATRRERAAATEGAEPPPASAALTLARARAEAALLDAIATATVGEGDLGRILAVALDRLGGAIPFTGGSIALVEGDDLVIRAAVGPFARSALGRRLARGDGLSWRVVETGEPALIGNIAAAGLRPTDAFQSYLAVPLAWRDRPFGLLEIDSTEANAFDAADLALVRKAAAALGGPVEVARRIATEAGAVATAEAARQRLAFLAEASAALNASLDYEDTSANLARLAVPRLADWCVVTLREEDGGLRQLAAAHTDPAKGALVEELTRRYAPPADAPYGYPRVLGTGRPDLIPEIPDELLAAVAVDAEHLALLRRVGLRSQMCVPLVARGRAIGALTLVSAAAGRRYDADDLALADELARRAAVAIDRARLYHSALEAREQFARQAARLNALAEISQALSEARLDLSTVLEVATHRVVEVLGDVCVLRLLSDDGQWLDPVALHHPDPAALAFARDMLAAAPERVDEGLNGRVMRTGRPLLLPVVRWEEVRETIKPEYRQYVERFGGVHSVLIVPLRVWGRVTGVLSASRETPGRPYTTEDQAFLQDLADRVAQAIDNARLYREAREAVDARDRALAAAEAERDRLQQVVDVLPEAILIADATPRFVIGNRAAVDILGVDTVGQRVPVDDQDAYTAFGARHLDGSPYPSRELPLARAVLRGATVLGEQFLLRNAADGRDVPVLVNSTPLRDAEGTIVGGVVVFQDISAIKRVEVARNEFLTSASHDLKAPLTLIRGLAQLAQQQTARANTPESARLLEQLSGIVQATTRMTALINEQLDMARLQLGQPLELDWRPTDLVALARQAAAEQQGLSKGHRIRVETAAPALVGAWDAARIERVVTNLLSNAVKYSRDGGEVTLSLARARAEDGAWAILTVRDRGLGIPAVDLPHIFERFYRAGNVVGQIAGTGIGLASVRQIVEQHGGTVAAESQEGAGTRFTVRLPLDEGVSAE